MTHRPVRARSGRSRAAVLLRLFVVLGCALWACPRLPAEESQNAAPQPLSDDELDSVVTSSSVEPSNTIADTAWAITLTPREGVDSQNPVQDTLTFAGGLMRSNHATIEGVQPSVYSLDIGVDGQLVWESVQRRPNGTAVLWDGTLDGKRQMKGAASERLADGTWRSFTFVGTRVALSKQMPATLPPKLAAGAGMDTAAVERDAALKNKTQAALQAGDGKESLEKTQEAQQRLETELGRIRAKLQDQANLAQELTASRQQREQELIQVRRQLQDLQTASRSQAGDAETQRKQLENRLADARKALAAAQTALKDKNQALAERERALTNSRTDAAAQMNDLQRRLQRLTDERNEAQQQTQQAHTSNDQTLIPLQQEHAQLQATFKTAQEHSQQLETDLSQLREKIKTLQTSLEARTTERDAALKDKAQAQERLAAFQAKREADAKDRKASLATQRDNQDRARKHLEADLAQARARLADLEQSASRTTGLQKELDELRATLHSEQEARQKTEAALQTRATQSAAALTDAKTSLQARTDERDALQKTYASLQQDLVSAQASLRAKDQMLATHEQELTTLRTERDRAVADLHTNTVDHRQALERREQELAEAGHQIQDLQLSLHAQTAGTDEEHRNLQANLEQTRQALADARTALETNQRTLAGARADAAKQASEHQAAVQAQQTAQQQHADELRKAQERERALQTRIDHDQATLAAAKQDRQQLEEELQRTRGQLREESSVAQELEAAHEQVAELESRIASLQIDRETAQTAAAAQEAQAKKLQNELTGVQQGNSRLQGQFAQAQHTAGELEAELARTRNDQQEEQRRLHGEITQLEAAARRHGETWGQQTSLLNDLRRQLDAQRQAAASVEAKAPGAIFALSQAQQLPGAPSARRGQPPEERVAPSPQITTIIPLQEPYARRRERAMLMELALLSKFLAVKRAAALSVK